MLYTLVYLVVRTYVYMFVHRHLHLWLAAHFIAIALVLGPLFITKCRHTHFHAVPNKINFPQNIYALAQQDKQPTPIPPVQSIKSLAFV